MQNGRMKWLWSIMGCFTLLSSVGAGAETFIVKDGVPKAEIVIAPERPRMVSLAALELQYYLEKISGARLPITTKPSAGNPVKIYVGASAATQKLGVTAKGLSYGAFRVKSSENWLILLGADFDYAPKEPWPRKNSDIARATQEWDDISGSTWRNPMTMAYKRWWHPRNIDEIMARRYGKENRPIWNPNDAKWSQDYQDGGAATGFWIHDEGGSLNAVYAFLRSLGVRWYMPGELGEVIPKMTTIPLPENLDETVRPDFGLRCLTWSSPAGRTLPEILWSKRLGFNAGHEALGPLRSHGMKLVIGREENQKANPDFYALVGGKRDTTKHGTGTPCLSSDKLVAETVKYAREVFDHFDFPAVSVWPTDGLRKCECETCAAIPKSDYVWQFVNRVAKEVYKTHPDKLITCGAYTWYVKPPEGIDKFSPNVAVFIANRGRPGFNDPKKWNAYWNDVETWRKKLAPRRVVRNENNRYSLRDKAFPVIHPRAMAKDIHALKGISIGEYGNIGRSKEHAWHNPGISHLNYYVQSRFTWDADQDVDALLDEYYEKFYGPAAKAMRKAFEFAENNRPPPGASKQEQLETYEKLLELIDDARDASGGGVHQKRIDVIRGELKSLEETRNELDAVIKAGDPRKNNPSTIVRDISGDAPLPSHKLKNLKTGENADIETSFTVGWDKDAIVFDIHCNEPDMKNLFVTGDVWGGDSVAVFLETPTHAYYQIEVNPEGKIFDAYRPPGAADPGWSSLAQVKTTRGDDFWSVNIRIPVVSDADGEGDPKHFVIGAKPTKEQPWHFNVYRIRVRDWKKNAYGFSPTIKGGYHVPSKFARLFGE